MRLLKRQPTGWAALLFLSLIYLPACGPAAAFRIETASPGGQYRLKLAGRGEPLGSGVADSQRQVVTLESDKGSQVVATDDRFFVEDTGDFFLQRYPAYEWVNDSTLRLGDRSPGDRFQDQLIVTNRRNQPFDLVIVRYGKHELFFIYYLGPGKQLELNAAPQLATGLPATDAFYQAYSNGRVLTSDTVNAPPRSADAPGPLSVPVDIGGIDIPQKQGRRSATQNGAACGRPLRICSGVKRRVGIRS
jgi:hypothetical protein